VLLANKANYYVKSVYIVTSVVTVAFRAPYTTKHKNKTQL